VSSSTKAENAGGPESSGGGEGCGRGAQFSMTVFFEAQATQQSQAGAAQTTTAPATGGTTP
jgi:hypothetical protein